LLVCLKVRLGANLGCWLEIWVRGIVN
jgi:hypothetical protein